MRSQTMNGQSGYAAAASHWMGAFFPQICEPEQADGAVDLILICVKNDQLEPAIASIRPFVERHTILLPLLNGVTATQRLRAAFPENTVLCGLAMALDAVRTESSVVHSSDGEIQFGMEDTVCYLPQVTAVDQFLCNAGIQTHVFPPYAERYVEKVDAQRWPESNFRLNRSNVW